MTTVTVDLDDLERIVYRRKQPAQLQSFRRNSSGSLAKFAAMRRASTLFSTKGQRKRDKGRRISDEGGTKWRRNRSDPSRAQARMCARRVGARRPTS